MTGHCDADVLAEFREGLLGRRRSARIRAHLDQCSSCASVSSGLAEVTALLASAPAPAMPQELTARLDRVLAAESAARAQAGTAAARGSNGATRAAAGQAGRRRGARPVPGRAARPARPWRATALRAASVTAAVLVIAGGGYGVSRLIQGAGGPSSRSAASGAGLPRAGASPAQARQVPRGGGSAGPNITVRVHLQVIQSGTDYRPGQLATQAETVLAEHAAGFAVTTPRSKAGSPGSAPHAAAGSAGSAPPPAAGSAGTAAPPGTAGSAALRDCVWLVTGGTRLLLVDLAHYQGRPATVIIEAPSGTQPGQVWVVGFGCSASKHDLIAHARLAATG